MDGLTRRVAARWLLAAADVSTPSKAADVIRDALASHYRDGYLAVEVGRGVSVKAGRMSENDFAKLRLTEGYATTGHNPLATVILAPSFGTSGWENLEVRTQKGGHEGVVLKALGIKPFRNLSGATPEKGVQQVIAYFTAHATALKDPHQDTPIRYG